MTLSERLREFSAFENCDSHEISVLRQAADEIDRLTADNAALRDERDDYARNILKLIATIKYISGIAERGANRKMADDETPEAFVLGYVKALEQERDALAATVDELLKSICWIHKAARTGASIDTIQGYAKGASESAIDHTAILAARDARTKAAALRDACDAWVATGAFSGERTQRIVADWLLTRANEIDKESSNG